MKQLLMTVLIFNMIMAGINAKDGRWWFVAMNMLIAMILGYLFAHYGH